MIHTNFALTTNLIEYALQNYQKSGHVRADRINREITLWRQRNDDDKDRLNKAVQNAWEALDETDPDAAEFLNKMIGMGLIG
jgi:hypothetical protein